MKESLAIRLALLAPAQVLVLAVLLVPALYLCGCRCTFPPSGCSRASSGWDNYARILGDSYFWRALGNTAVIVLVVVHVELLLGLGMALLFASGLPMRRLLLAVVLAPYAVSEVAAVVMWRYLFDPEVGHVTYALQALGLPPLDWAVEPFARAVAGGAAQRLAAPALHLHDPLRRAPGAAASNSTKPRASTARARWQAFRRVTLPLLVPALLIAALFRLIFAFRLFSEVWLMTGGGPAAARRSWPSTSTSKPSATTPSAPRRPRAGSWWSAACCSRHPTCGACRGRREPMRRRRVLIGVLKGWRDRADPRLVAGADPADPVLLAQARARDLRRPAAPDLLADLQHYAALWARWPEFFQALGNSLVITVLATLLAVAASLCSGYAYSRFRSRWIDASALFLIAVRLIPPIVCTLPLFPAANALGLQDTHAWLAILYATFFVSLGTFVMRAFIDQIPRELDEAAAVDGAGRLRTLFRVIARWPRRACSPSQSS